MPPLIIVKVKVGVQARFQSRHRLILHQIHMFTLHRALQAFDEDVIHRPASAIHTDANAGLFQRLRKRRGGELHPLARVKDFRLSSHHCRLQPIETEQAIECIRELPGQHLAAEPVQDRYQLHEPCRNGM